MSSGCYSSAQYPLATYCTEGLNLLSLSTQLSLLLHGLNLRVVALDFFNKILKNNKVKLPDLAEAIA